MFSNREYKNIHTLLNMLYYIIYTYTYYVNKMFTKKYYIKNVLLNCTNVSFVKLMMKPQKRKDYDKNVVQSFDVFFDYWRLKLKLSASAGYIYFRICMAMCNINVNSSGGSSK